MINKQLAALSTQLQCRKAYSRRFRCETRQLYVALTCASAQCMYVVCMYVYVRYWEVTLPPNACLLQHIMPVYHTMRIHILFKHAVIPECFILSKRVFSSGVFVLCMRHTVQQYICDCRLIDKLQVFFSWSLSPVRANC